MNIYCANCGLKLHLVRRAVPKYGTVVNIVLYHKCLDLPISYEDDILADKIEGADKFVQSLNELCKPFVVSPSPSKPSRSFGTDDLRDRRFEKDEVKSTAPSSILDLINKPQPSSPRGSFNLNPEEDE